MLSRAKVVDFQNEIFDWWDTNKRQFPWRETVDPYRVLVSEFMRQQTQANRVVPKYLEFIEQYSTISLLAESDNKELLTTWSGLGYNKRAIWLKSIATTIETQGFFPIDPQELRVFKGIGSYTSRSIPIFAFNANFAAVDINVRRVLIKYKFIKESTKKLDIQNTAEMIVPDGKSRDWHNALMDFASANLKGIKLSKTITKTFKGSTREIRGKIIKLLTISEDLELKEINVEMKIPVSKLIHILDKLERDKHIQKLEKKFSI